MADDFVDHVIVDRAADAEAELGAVLGFEGLDLDVAQHLAALRPGDPEPHALLQLVTVAGLDPLEHEQAMEADDAAALSRLRQAEIIDGAVGLQLERAGRAWRGGEDEHGEGEADNHQRVTRPSTGHSALGALGAAAR